MKYRRFLEQHITFYNGQVYCYRCKITLQNSREGRRHYEEDHSSVNSQISDFLNKRKLSKKNCMKLVQQGIIIRGIQQDYFCVYCQSSISSLHNFSQHLKEENHCKYVSSKSILEHSTNEQQKSNDNTNNEQSNAFVNVDNSVEHKNESNAIIQSISENMLMKDTSNNSMQTANETITNVPYALMEEAKTNKCFLMHHTIYVAHTYNGRWYCHLCKSILQSLTDMTCHLQAVHPDSYPKISDFISQSINIKLSDTNCIESLNHEIAMQDVLHDYFCVPCKCSFPSVNHFYGHLIGKRHEHMTRCNKKHENANVMLLEKLADKLNLNNTIDNQTIFVDVQNESDLIRNLPSSFKAEEESTILLQSYNKDSTSEGLQSESYIHMAFCCLCNMFICKTTIKNHINKNHKFIVSLFRGIQISNQQTLCIIKLEGERKTLRSLQLNNKKFDGTIWPEYAETVAKYTCDQCNEMVEQDDIINHEITIHKSSMMFSMKFIYNWTPSNRDLNATICYPLFKCSFCNEIIHGIASLQAHFLKCEHKENIKSLIDIKRQEFDSCKNIQIYLEPIEFLNLISFENNGGTIQIQEQPVMYIKNNYNILQSRKSPGKMQNTFTYVCFDCNYTAYKINDVINHLCESLRHLKHFKNILLTYMSIHNVSTSRELIVNEHEVKSPVSKEDVLIDNESLAECNIDKIQRNTEQCSNHNLIVKTNSSNTNRMSQNEENSSFFISLDIFSEMNTLIKKEETNWSTKLNKSALDRYNRMYWKDYLDFEEIMFVCNKRKLMKIKSNLQFFVPKRSSDKILCLICENLQLQYNIQEIYEHINSEKHIIKFNKLHENEEHLEMLKQLVKIQPAYTECFACDIRTSQNRKINIDFKNHIHISSHKNNCNRLRNQVEFILKEFQNLWYSIQYFACVDCNKRFKMKIKFMDHLNCKHREVIRKMTNSKFDFCLTCVTLWYKTNNTEDIHINYEKHCQLQMHQYLKRSNDFAVTALPQPLQELLRDVNKISANLFKLSIKVLNDPKVIQLTDALKHVFGTCQLPVEVFMFGSRVTGLALTNSDIDIYLNFDDECTEPQLIKRSKQIQDCLYTDHENWDIELTLNRSRTPIIKVKHRSTGLQCDISFTNGLSVENSKLIRSFNTAYPPCQKLTLFLKEWLSLAGLSGPDRITSYALVWLVIFYLQVKFKIPSIADLIKSHNQSKIISGWETGISDTILINVPQQPIRELLLGFFEYYGGFDYMRLVVCPLLGDTCQKKAFAEVILPNSMTLYITQLNSEKPEYFRIDSPMCVQDPYDLSHNLTKAVSILTLNRFKHYCNESLSVLGTIITES